MWRGLALLHRSMVARRIHRVPLLGWLVGLILGKGGRELGAAAAQGQQWGDPPVPCGVIAGTKNVHPDEPCRMGLKQLWHHSKAQ